MASTSSAVPRMEGIVPIPLPRAAPGMSRPLNQLPASATPLVYIPPPYPVQAHRVPVPAANSAINDIRYGLRSPNFGLRVEAVEKLVDLLPQQLLSEENAFVEALRAKEDSPVVVDALKDAIDFLSLVVTPGDTHLLLNVEKTAAIAKYFNALGRVAENGRLLDSVDEESQAEINDLHSALAECKEVLEETRARMLRGEDEFEKMQKKNEALGAQKADDASKISDLKAALQSKEEELEEAYGEYEHIREDFVHERKAMEEELKRLGAIVRKSSEEYEKRRSKLEDNVAQKQKTVDTLMLQLAQAMQDLKTSEERSQDYRQQMEEMKVEHRKELTDFGQNEEKLYNELQALVDAEKKKNVGLEEELVDCKRMVESFEEQLDDELDRNVQHEVRIDELDTALEKLRWETDHQRNIAEDERFQLEEQVATLKDSLEEEQEKSSYWKTEAEDLKEELQEMKGDNADLRERLTLMEEGAQAVQAELKRRLQAKEVALLEAEERRERAEEALRRAEEEAQDLVPRPKNLTEGFALIQPLLPNQKQ
ncbi:hypothetical protein QR680_008034 [Steinernema hermaphroditum]|uniref:Uncharacterized protein n=1 Tax=Steinernema hermaphroditum TaxID=289476 RepID=A0AA39IHA8_9BILA|nr:hypothetical protein QR680_008034 [Steinernema hermaphroditum]